MRPFKTTILISGLVLVLVLLSTEGAIARQVIAGKVEYGLAAQYPDDVGILAHPAVFRATGFETPDWAYDDLDYTGAMRQGYEHTTDPAIVLSGSGCLQVQQTVGTHQPGEIAPQIPEQETIYLRWYRRYEAGYDWTQHKMPGVYARDPPGVHGGAGVPPNGHDKFSCKLFVDWNGRPAFYSYHPDQQGPYGDHFRQNIGTPVKLETERWYCFEMMLKSNTPLQHDGKLKMWIDGIIKGHVEGLRFRDTDKLKINELTHSAYVGGTWVSERDQKLWDDNLVVATEYIGPMADTTPPEVSTVQVHESFEMLTVGLDRQVDEIEALRPDNFHIDQGVGILSVDLGADFQSVILTTTALVPGQSYNLSIHRIRHTAPNARATGIEAVFQVPQFQVLVDFGPTEAENQFGETGWSEVIKDIYTHYVDIGPGGTTIGVGSNAGYNFQGIRGTAHSFSALDQIRVTWHNASDEAVTFTPNISFDDPDRIDDGQAGTWYPMAAWYNTDLIEMDIPAGGSATTVFAFDSPSAGSHSLVNVNVNHENQRTLICDKIVLAGGGASCLVSARQTNAATLEPSPSAGGGGGGGGSGCFIAAIKGSE